MLQNIHKELDFLATALSFYLGDQTCMADCGRCCHQSFTIPRLSGLYIALAINTFPDGDRQCIVEQLEKWLLYEVPGARLHFSDDGQEEEKVRLGEYRTTAGLPCPLLSPDIKCLVYPWRDINCRAWGITRPASKICPRPFGKGEKEGNRRFITAASLELQRSALVDHLREHAPDWLSEYWMPTIVYAFLEPEKWRELYKRVQQTKYAPYYSDKGKVWLITAEDVRDNTLTDPEVIEAMGGMKPKNWG